MSVKKLQEKTARKPQGKCSKCGDEILPGQRYRFWKPFFRSRTKIVRCMKPECTPKMSERESSAMASVMVAAENAQAYILGWENSNSTTTGDLESALDEVGEAIDDVVSQYRDAADNFGGSGPNAEKADELEDLRSQLDVNFDDAPELTFCEDHDEGEAIGNGDNQYESLADLEEARQGCEKCQEANADILTTWRGDQAEEARSALEGIG